MDYPQKIKLKHPGKPIITTIDLNRSKSISNRVLIIKALCDNHIQISNLSDSDDSLILKKLLSQKEAKIYDVHHAGTTFRFLCSYLALQSGTQTLTGSSRMKERPIKALVDALQYLGADISYLENEGYPPLKIGDPPSVWKSEVSLPADISSQFISSLMMIAPVLAEGLKINLLGELVSKPYLDMTMRIMQYFGANLQWSGNTILVEPGGYKARPYSVEADWSAASYYYSMVAMAPQGSIITLKGLHSNSLQGDSDIAHMMETFGIATEFKEDSITIKRIKEAGPLFEYDFIEQPDLAQTVAVLCAGTGTHGLFSGLKTLRIKETDRISAMKAELAKFGVHLFQVPERFAKKSAKEYYMLEGTAEPNENASIDTYKDHRMAMAFAPLALKYPIVINDPGVVSKSYPLFWEHMQKCGFEIE